MRLQHLKQVAGVLSDENLARGAAKAMIITEVERLRWRIWNGKAKDAQISIDRIHALLPSVESEPARKLRRALDAVDRYLTPAMDKGCGDSQRIKDLTASVCDD